MGWYPTHLHNNRITRMACEIQAFTFLKRRRSDMPDKWFSDIAAPGETPSGHVDSEPMVEYAAR